MSHYFAGGFLLGLGVVVTLAVASGGSEPVPVGDLIDVARIERLESQLVQLEGRTAGQVDGLLDRIEAVDQRVTAHIDRTVP